MKKAVIAAAISVFALAALILCGLWLFPKEETEQIPSYEPLPDSTFFKEGYYTDPPNLLLICGNSTMQPSTWCLGWESYSAENYMTVFHATYPHPMGDYARHKTFVLEKNTVYFDLTAPPNSLIVTRWPKEELGKAEAAAEAEPVPHKMIDPDIGSFSAEAGYLYCITGHWKGGGVDYYFLTE